MPLIDVIIPVFNTKQEYLLKCFKSLQDQSFEDWRAIIIDDGSKQETAHYIDEYIKHDSRFEVYHYPNAGPSVARNRGLDKIEAPYVSFLDSDDEFTPTFLENGLEEIRKNTADLYICGSVTMKGGRVIAENVAETGIHLIENSEVIHVLEKAVSTYNTKETLFTKNALVARLYMKIYRKELLQEDRLDPRVRISEDSLYSFQILKKCTRIVIDSKIGYQINIVDESLSRGKEPDRAIKDLLDLATAFQETEVDLAKRGLMNAYRSRLLSIFTSIQNNILFVEKKFPRQVALYKQLTNDYRFIELRNVNLNQYIEAEKKEISIHKRILSKILKIRLQSVKALLLILDAQMNRLLRKAFSR